MQIELDGRKQEYDPLEAILYALPDTGAVLNVNTLSEPVVDQLISQYGGQGPLLGRKSYYEAMKKDKANAELKGTALQQELQKRLNSDLMAKLNTILDSAEASTIDKIKRSAQPGRGRLIEEAAAVGGINQPALLETLKSYDDNTNNAVSDFLGTSNVNRANQGLDFTKFLENILYGERRAGEQVDQFGKNLQFGYDKVKADMLNAFEERGQRDRSDLMGFQKYKMGLEAAEPGLMDQIQKGINIGQSGLNLVLGPAANSGSGANKGQSADILGMLKMFG